jgi:uncharacterized protein with PIN domain
MRKFLVTKELGRLARWLRILGYDTVYFSADSKKGLALKSLKQDRIILTRDTRFSKYAGFRTVHVKSDDFKQQIRQVIKLLRLKVKQGELFSRCIICNQVLKPAKKESVKKRVPEFVYETQEEFYQCPKCKRVYWQGTHWGNMSKIVKMLGKR